MTPQIIVGNVRKPTPEGYTRIYVGRRTSYKPEYGEDFSVLGNPYTMPRYTREEAVAEYRKWLKASLWPSPELRGFGNLLNRLHAGEKLALLCWCAPALCHATVIKEVLEGEA